MTEESSHLQKALNVLMLRAIDGLPPKERIRVLSNAGFGPGEIGKLVQMKGNAVRARMADLRRESAARPRPRAR